jgi:hypothetical protein
MAAHRVGGVQMRSLDRTKWGYEKISGGVGGFASNIIFDAEDGSKIRF